MEIQISFAVLTAIVVGLVQVAKGLSLPSRFAPVLALLLGVGLSFLAMGPLALTWVDAIVQGLVVGLSSVGLYSGVKNTIEKPIQG